MTVSEKVRIAIVGAGEMGARTSEGIANADLAEHAMTMDTSEDLAAGLAATYSVPYTTDFEDVLRESRVDAVYIAVPHYLHAPLAIAALRAGKHVLVEKPIATTLADADAMIAAAAASGRVLAVAYLAQIDRLAQQARQLIMSGAIGKVTGTRIVARSDKPGSYWSGGYTGRAKTDWRTRREAAGGGILIMNTSHDLNTVRFVTGLEVSRVYCELDTFVTPVTVEDFVAVVYRYQNGAIGSLEAGSAVRGRDPIHEPDRIYGERGQILLGRSPQIYLSEAFEGFSPGKWHALEGPRMEDSVEERTALIDSFVAAVQGRRPPAVSGMDGRAILEIVVAAYHSALHGRPVHLPFAEGAA